jgi:hypothetical protein
MSHPQRCLRDRVDSYLHLRAPGSGKRLPFKMSQLAALIFILTLSLGTASIRAQTKPTEFDVKAAYLYNFAKFVQWPADATRRDPRTFQVCVLGEDPFGPVLDRVVAGGSIDGRTVVPRRVASAQDARACHILFLGGMDERREAETLETLGRADVLTVSDLPAFTQRGGMIQFVVQGARVRFEVNLDRARDAGLMLSSELLRVALAVHRG